MYGGSSKLGRVGGGGRGGGGPRNRSSFPPPPPHRPAAPTGRLSLGSAPRNRPGTGGGSGLAPAVEESFSLVSGNNPLAFAMMIRLAPDLVEEIRRLEAQGGTARIKFDSLPTNPSGNVIDVGGKEFRFTWSKEFGDLCDIYEERQSGEDGNGLLVESGCAWRKLNVQRVLDESMTNHVKMRSEEAERKHKSRKAIVLEHGNPSMKNQIKQLAAAEASPWKSHFKKKEPAFKKRKVEAPQAAVGGPPKSGYKSGLISASNAKGGRSTSPLPSPPERSGAAASPIGTGNIFKIHSGIEDVMPIQVKSKENPSSSEKEIPTRATSAVCEMPGRRGNLGPKPMDLQSLLITLLKENPKGLSLKALEKAVGDTIPNSARKIEPILKKIATFQAPGRYFLKPGVELDSLKKPSSESGSSPEDNRHQTPALEENDDQTPAPVPSLEERVSEMEEQNHLNSKPGVESNVLEQIDIEQHSPDLGGERKASDNSEGRANSVSDSGSDSDSDSDSSDSGSDSGSHSRSRSRSGSPGGSGSGSSSDSESDASSNSKEGSDEDVDIMTSDDDKETKQDLQASEPGLLTSPLPWQTEHGRPLQNGMDENQDGDGYDAVDIEGNGSDAVDVEGHGSDAVDIEKDLPEDEQQIEMAVTTKKEGEKPEEGAKPSSSDHDELQERQNFIGNLFDDTENIVKDSVRHEQSDNSERLAKAKSKRGSDLRHFNEKSERTKRLKSESLSQPHVSGSRDPNFSGTIRNLSPSRHTDEPYQSSSVQMMNKGDREDYADFGSQKGNNQLFPRKSSSDFHQSGRRPSDQGAWTKATNAAERPMKHAESSGHGRKFNVHEGHLIPKDNPSRDTQNEDGLMKDKKLLRNPKEGGAGGKNAMPSDFHHRKHETVGKLKDAGQISSSYINSSPKDNSRVNADRYPVNGKSNMLQRELSHLELGEIREPLVEETPIKKQFERKSSFKHSGSGPSTSDNFNPDLSRGKSVGKTIWDSGRPSPTNLGVLRRTPEHHVEDLTRSHHNRVVQSQPQHLTRVDRPEVGSHSNKLADISNKNRQNETGAKMGVGLEGYGESHKKAPATASQQQELKRGSVSQAIKDSKILASNKMADATDGRKDTALTEGNVNGRKRRGSSSDEECCPYSKYEKDEPEYKGPIKDSSQYEEYMNEFREKYESYNDLDKTLQTYRNDFEKLGKDLEYTKDRDMEKYYKTLNLLLESYNQCGMRHKRLKKIFVVLHYELKNLKERLQEYAQSHSVD